MSQHPHTDGGPLPPGRGGSDTIRRRSSAEPSRVFAAPFPCRHRRSAVHPGELLPARSCGYLVQRVVAIISIVPPGRDDGRGSSASNHLAQRLAGTIRWGVISLDEEGSPLPARYISMIQSSGVARRRETL